MVAVLARLSQIHCSGTTPRVLPWLIGLCKCALFGNLKVMVVTSSSARAREEGSIDLVLGKRAHALRAEMASHILAQYARS